MLIKRFGGALLLTLLLVAAAPTPLGPASAYAQSDEAQEENSGALDEIILRSGRIIEGRILSETATEVEVMVVVAGIEAPATYSRSEILKINRGAGAKAESSDDGDSATSASRSEPKKAGASGAPNIYLLEVDGRLIGENGLDAFPRQTTVTASSLEDALEDAQTYDPKAIIVKLDVEAASGLSGVFVAEHIGPVFEELIYDDNERIVFWIDRAVGGAGLLPFVSPEIYFTSEGRMGGLTGIGEISSGDTMVDEKLISAALGHAEGFAIKGGYEFGPQLIRAMARQEEWLAVRWRGGEPQFIEWEPRPEIDGPEWTVLTDDGEGENADESPLMGNDVLNLDATLAERLRVSKGTYDLIDDLIYDLEIGRDYEIVEGKGSRILEDYGERVARAFDEIRALQQDLEDADGNSRREVGRQIQILKKLRGLLASYAEALDPSGAQRSQIDVRIEALRQAIAESNRRERERGRRGR